jgi:hypothetical protein
LNATPAKPIFDHAVYAGTALYELVEQLADKTGVRPTPGGAHEALGTHNALLRLGDRQYLELLAPIPGAEDRSPFARSLSAMERPKLYMWAVRVPGVEAFVAGGEAAGLSMGATAEMSRKPPVGKEQHWKLSVGGSDVYDSVVPFGIEWTGMAHPADDLESGCLRIALRAEHPQPQRILDAVTSIGVELDITEAPRPGLVLDLDTPQGPIELR